MGQSEKGDRATYEESKRLIEKGASYEEELLALILQRYSAVFLRRIYASVVQDEVTFEEACVRFGRTLIAMATDAQFMEVGKQRDEVESAEVIDAEA